MVEASTLTDKIILVVDDEPDVLDAVKDILHMCVVHTAQDHETAIEYLLSYTYDVVILDIMGVKGFELLRVAVEKHFPALMLTAHALTPDALKTSMKLGAVSFLPKEKLSDLEEFIQDVVLNAGGPAWTKFFDKLGEFFNKRFGPDWKEKDEFFREFEEELRSMEKRQEEAD